MTLEEFKKKAAKLPDAPGVYFFLDARKKVLYIGKATSLRSRVRSYFASDLPKTRGQLIVSMVEKAKAIDWRQTDSVLEALLLEASLIRTHKPPHNTDLKDDKSFNHVVITKEDPPAGGFPRVLLVRGKNLEAEFPPETRLHTFGPFPHGAQLKEALKIIRKIFPYRDTCVPCKYTKVAPLLYKGATFVGCKPCFNRHIGLCPGVCSGEISKTEYERIIRRIVMLFQGKKSTLLKSLERDMKIAAKKEAFEEAARLRGQMFALQHIQDVSLIKDEYRRPFEISSFRIEAYDAAHLGGSAAVGVMTVVEDGAAAPAEYRKFILRATKAGDDPGALKEILSRRLGHSEWPLPKLIVIDGSTAQLNAAHTILKEFGVQIPLVGVTKDEKHRPRALQGLPAQVGDKNIIKIREKEILLANAEAHRFAIGFHRKKLRDRL
ncbi:MAG: GIY-YIG nuclease family protein [bacterium]